MGWGGEERGEDGEGKGSRKGEGREGRREERGEVEGRE